VYTAAAIPFIDFDSTVHTQRTILKLSTFYSRKYKVKVTSICFSVACPQATNGKA